MHFLNTRRIILCIATLFSTCQTTSCDIQISTHEIDLKLHSTSSFTVSLGDANSTIRVNFSVQHHDILKLNQTYVELEPNSSYEIVAEGTVAGYSEITSNSIDADVDELFVRVNVYKDQKINVAAVVMGWIYFVTWSVAFYPQIYVNWKRKSVVGLNFDYIALNILGYSLYTVFTVVLYFDSVTEVEYLDRHPRSLNPVQVNDVFFVIHAILATLVITLQCVCYERGDQRVSKLTIGILIAFVVALYGSLVSCGAGVIHCLDFLYVCAYIKLTITLIKYVPQAYMNYKRKSTVGWSIGKVYLDFIGGVTGVLQMLLSAYNYNDWVSIFGDPTKFGFGVICIIFDAFFIFQHYALYNPNRKCQEKKEQIEASTISTIKL